MPSRRSFVMHLAAAGAAVHTAASRAQQAILAQQPDPNQFETGDLVWPKPAGAFIPYAGVDPNKAAVSNGELAEEEWQKLRVDFIRSTRASAAQATAEDRTYQLQLAQVVEDMTYTSFINKYAADSSPEDFQTYGIGQLAYVGHVAFVEVDAATKTPYVVEAVYGKNLACESCVQRVRYADWLKARGDILVWHGRLKNLDAAQRGAVLAYAKSQQNKPYRFFNFDLADDSGFYCSKLVWQSVKKATGVAIDGNDNPKRAIWFSPLQLMKSRAHIGLLSSPGNYRNT
ncbi:hypothetical protein H8N03_06655 [Ramlibacter sp. USB13]|uniref:Twin-arginine translocation signal domain-containing protein n=1 Tax=Ramlibacter cellulosilyticus TaxID=2764187 RepID=A0A923SAC1_9BURK|nr:YiiX/YebB-like N1pC/P60 family cysteine hydrolase [Ramlibacter cellulosilyticus]MBC5782619.1 hypothetical protein [Ramlibacter cellulosilyticus]